MNSRLCGRAFQTAAVAAGMALTAAGGVQAAQQGQGEPASGAAANPNTSVSFSKLDKNSNGTIDPQEARASKVIGGNFQQLDQNHDQQLDRSEFAAFDQQRMRVKRIGPPGEQVNAKRLQESGGAKPAESWFTLPEDKPD